VTLELTAHSIWRSAQAGWSYPVGHPARMGALRYLEIVWRTSRHPRAAMLAARTRNAIVEAQETRPDAFPAPRVAA
jgi:uncharacterized protein YbdZ (MbtH family)